MAKDFSNPKKLGFMRVLQFFFAFNVIVTISLLAFLIKGSYELEFSNILDFVNLIFDSISFWLIWQRKRLARHFIIGFSLFNIFIGTAFNIATGHFSLVGQLFSCTPDLILLAYFLTSRRAKAVLTQPFDAEVKHASSRRTWTATSLGPGRSGATSSFTSACSAWWDTGWRRPIARSSASE